MDRSGRRLAMPFAVGAIALAVAGATQAQSVPAAQTLGAEVPFFEDGFTEPGAWGEASDERGTLANEDGAFAITIAQDGASLWTWANFTDKDVAWLIEADITVEAGPGAGGLMCGSDADTDDFLVGAVNGANEWGIAHIGDSHVEFLTGGRLPDPLDLTDGGSLRLGLECAVTGTAADQVRLWADGQLLGSLDAAPRIGPFDLVGLYGNAPQAPWTARIDDLAIRSGAAYRPPAVRTLGATLLAASDDFSEPGAWATPSSEAGVIRYDGESLLIDLTAPPGHMWTWRDLTKEAPVLRVEGSVDLEGTGAAGFMCGPAVTAGSELDFLVGLVTSAGGWRVDRLTGEQVSAIAEGPLPEGVGVGSPVSVAVECAAGTGGDRVAVWVDGVFAGATSVRPSLAPYLLVGAYGISGDTPLAAHVDDVGVLVGERYAPVAEP